MHHIIFLKDSRRCMAFFMGLLGSCFLILYSCDTVTGPPRAVKEQVFICFHKRHADWRNEYRDPEISKVTNREVSRTDKANGIRGKWRVAVTYLHKFQGKWHYAFDYYSITKKNNSYSCGG